MKHDHYYLLSLQYLGFRYHGWQKQPGVKTVEQMLERTVRYVLGGKRFKLLGASRTDAMVSAHHSLAELFISEPLDLIEFKASLNKNLPADIHLLDIREVDAAFNIIQSPKLKEYHYYFCLGEMHPFCAPFMTSIEHDANIGLMMEAARLFRGHHNFVSYCVQPSPGTRLERDIIESAIERETHLTASFFPEELYVYKVKGAGFLRQQVRSMMGALIRVGQGEWICEDIVQTLQGHRKEGFIAPASGLHLAGITV